MIPSIKIGETIISERTKPYFIADIAANHDGDIQRAYKLIELAKEAGADAAKFQNFKADLIVSRQGFESLGEQLSHQSSWKKSVYEVYKDASLKDEWTEHLHKKCQEVGIEYMTSPYDFASIDIADRYVSAFKIGSGDITWTSILSYFVTKNKPILLATGASSMEDVERAANIVKGCAGGYALMQCNTNYTAAQENLRYINLNVLNTYRRKFPDAVLGLSDHTAGDVTVLGAVAIGARIIEKHFTDDNSRTGPDHAFSMTPDSWKTMVNRVAELFQALGDGNKKIEDNEQQSAIIQRRSVYVIRDMKEGEVLTADDIFPLRPIKPDEIPPYEIGQLIGKKLKQSVKKDSSLHWEDLT